MNLIEAVALLGAITGTTGLSIALLTYFRDRPVVKVAMQWDMKAWGSMPPAAGGYLVVTTYNTGRRPIYLSHVHLPIPKRAIAKVDASHIMIATGLRGTTIPEGGAPRVDYVEQRGLEKYAQVWPLLRAAVVDASGRTHFSDWPTKRPDWAANVEAGRMRIFWNRFRNWLRRHGP